MTSTINPDSKIAIIGAGIGGLSLAVALARLGMKEIVVFERRKDLQELGAGLQIGPNASRILGQLGYTEKLEDISERFPQGQIRSGASGQKLADLPLDDWAWRAYGAHNYQLLRTDLHQMLWDGLKQAAGKDPVRLGKELVELSNIDDRPLLGFSDGTEEIVDLVIGADGVRSAVRCLLFEGSEASYSGYFAWRGLVSADRLPQNQSIGSMLVWTGERKHLIAYPLNQGKLVNLVGVCESSSWPIDSVSQKAEPNEWLDNYAGWDTKPLSLISALETCDKWTLHRLPPLDSWSRGCVGLLGDAAHPMMPSLAQGAAQSMEDAVCLARLISEARYDAEQLFGVYFEQRSARARRVQEAALWNLKYFHRRKTLFSQLQDVGMRLGGRMTTNIIARRYHWLYR